MGRIEAKFAELGARGRKAFMPFLVACDPTPEATVDVVLALEGAGADMVELGFAYSDPIADGPVIQDSYSRVLDAGHTVADALSAAAEIRKRSNIPIAAMVSYSIVWKKGLKAFADRAARSGIDALIVPDLPPEEADDIIAAAGADGLGVVFLVTPVTDPARVGRIVAASRPFIYYVSVVGTTGARRELPAELSSGVAAVKGMTDKPVVVGFGVSTAEQAAIVARAADGVILGSAVVRVMSEHRNKPASEIAEAVAAFARPIAEAIHG